MANYDQLPVFKATYDLLLRIFHLCRHWQRDIRHTLGENLKKELLSMEQLVYQANSTTDKVPYISQARLAMVNVKLQIRIAHDLKEVSLHQYASLAEQAEDISKQLAAWEKAVRKKTVKKQA